jgi:hypothetical protein
LPRPAAGPVVVDGAVEICHGSPLDEDLYVVADIDAAPITGAHGDLPVRPYTVALTARMDSQRRLEIEAPQGHWNRRRHRRRPQPHDQPGSVKATTATHAPRMRLRTSIAGGDCIAWRIHRGRTEENLDAGLPLMLA